MGVKIPIEERFWAKVSKGAGNDCWIWKGGKYKHPRTREETYGCISVGSRRDKSKRMVAAHKVSWEIANGPVPAGKKVCHRCDVPACVRPDHLFLGTQGENVNDMIKKGRAWWMTGAAE
jgi:hypothetical protein